MKKVKIPGTIRENLVTRLEYLQGLLNGSTIRLKAGHENYADTLDRASAEHDRVVELTIRHSNSEEIKEITEALQRMEKGQYGICVHCGGPIAQKRLLLAPMSRLCVACKAEMETAQHVSGGWRRSVMAFNDR